MSDVELSKLLELLAGMGYVKYAIKGTNNNIEVSFELIPDLKISSFNEFFELFGYRVDDIYIGKDAITFYCSKAGGDE